MKKFTLMLSASAIMFVGFATVAEARTETEVVGYVKTETVINDRDVAFNKADTSGDGAINFKEFQNASVFENEYEMFNMNDTNNDDLLTIEEFRVFSKQGPSRVADGPSLTNYNFNKKGSHY